MGLQNVWPASVMERLGQTFTLEELEQRRKRAAREAAAVPARWCSGRWSACTGSRSRTTKSHFLLKSAASPSASFFPSRRTRATASRTRALCASSRTTAACAYYATYTAYNGRVILPQLIETADFLHFQRHHAQRPRRAEQRHGALSATDRRPLRDALASG